MKTKTLHCQLDSDLILYSPAGKPLSIAVPKIVLINKQDTPHACRLSFKVSWELYQQIDIKALFNLNSQIRGNFSGKGFVPDAEVIITGSLRPNLLIRFAEYLHNIEGVAPYLKTLSQEQPDDPLVSTESWYTLHVEQQQEGRCVGYRTFWHYLKWSASTPDPTEKGKMMQSLFDFLSKERKDVNVSVINQQGWEELLDLDVDKLFNAFATDIETFFKELENEESEVVKTPIQGELFAVAVDFFAQENWQTYQVEGDLSLQMVAQGQNGQWNCQMMVNEEWRQLVFYSLFPVNVPETKLLAMAEFLSRANWGMLLGNFELDFNDGQIRYKTSIDVSGDRLTTALMQQLVYANVLTMNRYLPGIMSAIYSKVSPAEAIAQVED